jgi:hypothetical protein
VSWLPVLGVEDTELGRVGSGLAAAGRAELAEHGRDMAVDCAHGNHELAGDLGVRVALAEQAQHVDLPDRQARRIDLRLASRPTRNMGRAERTQAPADQGGQGRGAELIQDP